MYLFGASPALHKGFMRGNPHQLEELDAETLYLPYATSLRMSDLGYQSNAQADLTPCYNDLHSYTDSLRQAVGTPYPPYVDIGAKKDGEWLQLNTHYPADRKRVLLEHPPQARDRTAASARSRR